MLDFVDRNVILSIKPQFATDIIAGHKTIELRRRFASEVVVGSVAFIYASSPVQCMVGYARIADVRYLSVATIWRYYRRQAAISRSAFESYFLGLKRGFAIELADARPLTANIPATVLRDRFGFRAPQSFRYATSDYSTLIA